MTDPTTVDDELAAIRRLVAIIEKLGDRYRGEREETA